MFLAKQRLFFSSQIELRFSKFDFLEPCPTEGPVKSLLSACLPVRQFSIFLRNVFIFFSDFLLYCK